MIDPPVTNSPENTLIPSRCELESRPFFELPRPFLCAIDNPLSRLPLGHNLLHLHARKVLAVPDGAFVLLLAFELEDDDFVAAPMLCNCCAHACTPQCIAQDQFIRLVRDSQHSIKFHITSHI